MTGNDDLARDGSVPVGDLKPHDRFSDWLVDDDGGVWDRVREWTCPFHPYGPEREPGGELTACEQIVLDEWDSLDPDTLPELYNAAYLELGLCCRGREWRDTGRVRRVSSIEMFVRENMPPPPTMPPPRLASLINEILSDPLGWPSVRIPPIVTDPDSTRPA